MSIVKKIKEAQVNKITDISNKIISCLEKASQLEPFLYASNDLVVSVSFNYPENSDNLKIELGVKVPDSFSLKEYCIIYETSLVCSRSFRLGLIEFIDSKLDEEGFCVCNYSIQDIEDCFSLEFYVPDNIMLE